jgi:hypothetical protein
MPLPCKSDKTTGCNLFALLRSLFPSLQQKFAMPRPMLKAIIVLSDFVRSLSAEEKIPGLMDFKDS